MSTTTARFTFVFGARSRDEVAAYLPSNYALLGEGMRDGRTFYVVGGYDRAGWTLDAYVMPRLASGVMGPEEVTEIAARAVVSCSSDLDSYIGLPAAGPATAEDIAAALRGEWRNHHLPNCQVTRDRADLLRDLAADPGNVYLLGAVPEYDRGGDQESENCTCLGRPTAKPAGDSIESLARALIGYDDLGSGGDQDITEVYEALAALLPRSKFVRLGAALELCPLHFCDIRICADDGIHGDEVYDAIAESDDSVYVVLTLDENPFQTEVEVLSSPPKWDLDAAGQIVFEAGLNGGDSRRWLGPDSDNQDEIDRAIAAEEVRYMTDTDDPRP